MFERLCQYENSLGELLYRTRLSHPDHQHLLDSLRKVKSCSEEDLHCLNNTNGYCLSPNLDSTSNSKSVARSPSMMNTRCRPAASVSALACTTSSLVPPTRKPIGKSTWYASKSTGSLLQACSSPSDRNNNIDPNATTTSTSIVARPAKKSRKPAINWPFRRTSTKSTSKSLSEDIRQSSETNHDSGLSLDFSSSSSTSSTTSSYSTSSSSKATAHTAINRTLKRCKPMKLFGQSINKLCQDNQLIWPVMNLLTELMSQGPKTVGIFRKSANARVCRELKTQLEQFPEKSLSEFPVPVIASVLKELLRSLPDCLLQSKLYLRWMDAVNDKNTTVQCSTKIKNLLQQLPSSNLLLLRHLMCVLSYISLHCQTNKMNSLNLGVCIGPSLLTSKELPTPQRCEELSKQVPKLVAFLIDHCADLFGKSTLCLLGDYKVQLDLEDEPIEIQSNDSNNFKDSGAEESDTMPSLGTETDNSSRSDSLCETRPAANASLRPFADGGSKHSLQQLPTVSKPLVSNELLPPTLKTLGNKNSLSNLSRDSGLTLSDTHLYSPAEEEAEEEDDYQHVINHHLQLSSKLAALSGSAVSTNCLLNRPRANSIARTKSVALERKELNGQLNEVCSAMTNQMLANDEDESSVFDELNTSKANHRTSSLDLVSGRSDHTLRLPVHSPEHIYSVISENNTSQNTVRSHCLSSSGSEDVFFGDSPHLPRTSWTTTLTRQPTAGRSVISISSAQPPSYQETMSRKQHTARLESIISLPTPEPQLTARAVPVRVCSPEHTNQARLVDVVDGIGRFRTSIAGDTCLVNSLPSVRSNLTSTRNSSSSVSPINLTKPAVQIQQQCAKDANEPWRSEIQSSVASIREKFMKMASSRANSVSYGPVRTVNRIVPNHLKNSRNACKSLGSLHDLVSESKKSSIPVGRNVTIIQVPAASRRHSLSSSEEESYV